MKSTVALLAALLLSAAPALADVKSNIQYGSADKEKLLLDVGMPSGPGPFPIMIIIHGGGWGSGDKAKDISVLFDPLIEANFVWVSINYRLAPKHPWPDCLEDTQTAIRWVKAHASEYKGDPDKIALFCYSASGLMAGLTSEEFDPDTRVQAVVGFDPVTDLENDLEKRGGLSPALRNLLHEPLTVSDESRAILHEISPVNHIRPGMPPYLLIQGDADKTVMPEGTALYAQKLKQVGVPVELMIVHGTPHNILKWEKIDTRYKQKIVDWLTLTLTGKPATVTIATTQPTEVTIAQPTTRP